MSDTLVEQPAPESSANTPPPEAPLTDEQRELAGHFASVVETEAKKMAAGRGKALGYDELVSWGHKGLIKAVRDFDPHRGVPIRAHVIACVRYAMWEGIRVEAPHQAALATAAMRACDFLNRRPLDPMASETVERMWIDGCEEGTVMTMLASYTWATARKTEEAVLERDATRRSLQALDRGMAKLGPDDRSFIEEYYHGGRTLAAIAESRRMSYDVAKKHHVLLLKRLSKQFGSPRR